MYQSSLICILFTQNNSDFLFKLDKTFFFYLHDTIVFSSSSLVLKTWLPVVHPSWFRKLLKSLVLRLQHDQYFILKKRAKKPVRGLLIG